MGKLPVVVSSALLALAGCAGTRHVDVAELLRSAGEAKPPPAETTPLAEKASLDAIERIALAANADLEEARARVRASAARAEASGALPDLEVKYEQWGVPLARPWALGDGNALMVGLRQSLPAPGTRAAQGSAADEEARMTASALAARRLDVLREVRRTYFEYFLADRGYAVHQQHTDLTERLVELARANFRAGRAKEADILALGVELTRVHSELASLEASRRSAAALLNTLMGRDPEAPLGPPEPLVAEEVTASPAMLAAAVPGRPEVTGAEHAALRSAARRDEAERAASWPSFMVGLDYMYMPGMADPQGYGAMLSINLPWLNPARGAAVRAAASDEKADRSAVAAARSQARYQIADAWSRYRAASERWQIVERDLVPQAGRAFEAAHASYAAGGGDAFKLVEALRTYLEVRLDRERALVELEGTIADLERASGGPVPRRPRTDGGQP